MTASLAPGRSTTDRRPRIALARALIRLGRFVQSAAIMVMREDDLVEFGRQTYARPNNVAGWSDEALLAEGLNADEARVLDKLPCRQGRLLLLGVGGGREAIPLARMGFAVTGLDFVPEMVEAARSTAARQGLALGGLVQDISRLQLVAQSYDVVWLSAGMYSCVPTRRRRMAMLACIREALPPRGYFVCGFLWCGPERYSRKAELLRKGLAWLTLGNLSYEPGDTLWTDIEFIHRFSSEQELRAEFAQSGFEVEHFHLNDALLRGEALLKKPGL